MRTLQQPKGITSSSPAPACTHDQRQSSQDSALMQAPQSSILPVCIPDNKVDGQEMEVMRNFCYSNM